MLCNGSKEIQSKPDICPFSLQVLHSLVCSVERQSSTASGFPLILYCKNFQSLCLLIAQEQDCHDVLLSLQRLSQPGKVGLGQNQSRPAYWRSDDQEGVSAALFYGWQRGTRSSTVSLIIPTLTSSSGGRSGPSQTPRLITTEWDSQTPCGNSLLSISSTRWVQPPPGRVVLQGGRPRRLCCYSQVSDTYPADLFVPKSAAPPVIVGSSKFRSRGRFPALSYYYKENQVCWWHFSSLCKRWSNQTFCRFCLCCLF